MGFVVVLLVIVVIIAAVVIPTDKKKDAQPSQQKQTFAAPIPQTPAPEDTLEKQNIYGCTSRFCNAVNAIRQADYFRSTDCQTGYYTIKLQDDKYTVSAYYDHYSESYVLSALTESGYLNYYGFRYVDGGFDYTVEGITPNPLAIPDDGVVPIPYHSVGSLIEALGKFLNDPIAIEDTVEDKNYLCVRFHFR